MDAMRTFTIAEVLTGALLIASSISLSLKVRENIPAELRKEWVYTLSLMVFCFVSYIFLALILMGNVRYPMEEVAGSMFLAIACAVYIAVILIKTTIKNVTDKDREVTRYDDELRKRAVELERDVAAREKMEFELQKKLDEVERLNKLLVGRELKMDELRQEIANLKSRTGEAA